MGGFCTFNELMVTACALREEGLARRVGILDFDQHWGDGADDIVKRLDAHWIEHYSAGAHWNAPNQANQFPRMIPSVIESMAESDVMLYQAGADPHVDNPLGGWLTTAQLRERDRLVFESASRYDIPIAWNLARGYQDIFSKVLEIRRSTTTRCSNAPRFTNDRATPSRGNGRR